MPAPSEFYDQLSATGIRLKRLCGSSSAAACACQATAEGDARPARSCCARYSA